MPLDLYFPLLNGGVEQGLNDAGIETFEGGFQQHIVRECTQNALDARAGAEVQVRVEIRLRQISADGIPGLTALRAAIQSSREYWQGNDKTEVFCAKALSWTEGGFIGIVEDGIAACGSVRDPVQIPEPFRRSEIGTSLFIVAYRHLGGDDWADAYSHRAFAPLDDIGRGFAGCTEIQYLEEGCWRGL